jgi:hypothetical protein
LRAGNEWAARSTGRAEKKHSALALVGSGTCKRSQQQVHSRKLLRHVLNARVKVLKPKGTQTAEYIVIDGKTRTNQEKNIVSTMG